MYHFFQGILLFSAAATSFGTSATEGDGLPASEAQSNSTKMQKSLFTDCPESYTAFCHEGSCRYLVSESTASCICPGGFDGDQCQYVNLLSVLSVDVDFLPHAVAILLFVAVVLILASCLAVYICRRSMQSKTETEIKCHMLDHTQV
ncbi:protransforming growth factor alpha-like [Lepisosteus oculatus]|uniref:protransforming growth factor alpha-like n=1 Tax=Lepisosteus oculatus TaxID=7918 RepID=UPI00073FF1E9|nr:PREDICTED: protransforming growth factor alpha-like [Lepisosteus oculatus]